MKCARKTEFVKHTISQELRQGNYSTHRLCFWERRDFENHANSKLKKELWGLLGNLQNLHKYVTYFLYAYYIYLSHTYNVYAPDTFFIMHM
jgi:hypothetical protein